MKIKINGIEVKGKELKTYSFITPTLFLAFNPMALLDFKIIGFGLTIVGLAYLEKRLADQGFISIAEILYKVLTIGLAVSGCGLAVYFILKAASVFVY